MRALTLLCIGIFLLAGCTPSAPSPAEKTKVHDLKNGEWMQLTPQNVQKQIGDHTYDMYGYNKQIPGPLIKATQGDTIKVGVNNAIDRETTVHWHGIRLDNKFDGVPKLTQDPVKPGDSFTHDIHVPDEGIYWYHPHVREDIQQDLGLYGNLFVRPEDPDAYNPVNGEEFLIFDDIMTDYDGSMIPHGEEGPNYALMGRFGDVLLVNGETSYEKTVQRGSVLRFYLTNVASTRTFRFMIPETKMKLVGSDVGRYERDEWVDAVILGPAERYIVEVLFDEVGDRELLHASPLSVHTLGKVTVVDQEVDPSYRTQFETLRSYDDVSQDIEQFRKHFSRPVDKRLILDIEMMGAMAEMDHSHMMAHSEDGIEWEDLMPGMNEIMKNEDLQWKFIDEETGNVNMDIKWKFNVGDIVKVSIENKEEGSPHPMQHPIHFHGQRFLVLSMDGVPNQNLVWKDTVLIPMGQTAELLFDMSNPGKWMFHCHIAEHLSNGMMGMITVSP